MIVCHCQDVNDATIRMAIDAGAADEFDVAAVCSAGSQCGGCVPTITDLLEECRACPLRVEWSLSQGAAVA